MGHTAQKTVVAIPARMAATRLPGKPLADIVGEPMIVHVWRRAVESEVGDVLVAASEPEVVEAVEKAGGRAVLTDPDLPSGTDRICQALQRIDPDGVYQNVINLQGDFPTLDPRDLAAVMRPLDELGHDMGTLVCQMREDERKDSAKVKAVVSWTGENIGRALYFTRSETPWGDGPLWHHIGIYSFRRATLEKFTELPPSPLEKRERLEQLRALEAGMAIGAVAIPSEPFGVDTPDDLERARKLLEPR